MVGAIAIEPNSPVGSLVVQDKPKPLHVFISYRVHPDAGLASAVKVLIEACIEPPPEVFVSGDGGLRASNQPFKLQIRDAARKADAFVAIITDASIDREWIFFEAGAAWGQDRLYAPLLIGSKPEDMPSTIADYQAFRWQNKGEVFRLIEDIARLGTAQTKKQNFGQRYPAFARTVEDYLQGDVAEKAADPNEDQELNLALRYKNEGNLASANELFDAIETRFSSRHEDLCRIKLYRAGAFADDGVVDEQALGSLLTEFDTTSIIHFYMAFHTKNDLEQRRHLAKAAANGHPHLATIAEIQLAKLNHDFGDEAVAISTLWSVVTKNPRTGFAEKAASTVLDLDKSLEPLEKLGILISAMSGKNAWVYSRIGDLARENGWLCLALYATWQSNQIEGNPSRLHSVGMAMSALNLPSLAYDAFMQAAAKGISVGYCNAASVISRGPCPRVGLEHLGRHTERFDAADPSFPYEVRRRLEAAVHQEEEDEAKYRDAGKRQYLAMLDIFSTVLEGASDSPLSGAASSTLFSTTTWKDVGLEGPSGSGLIGPAEYKLIRPFGGRLFQVGWLAQVAILHPTPVGFWGVRFADFRQGEGLQRFGSRPTAPKS